MNNPKISIIVPVYKVEQYIRVCLDSILSSTFIDFELLLVDDGSPDQSGAICDEYAQQDNRIKVFHKPNGGVSSARNFGLEKACGEWVTFCDSDDFISPSYLEDLYEPIKSEPNLTFVHAGCVKYFDTGIITPLFSFVKYMGDDKSLLFERFEGYIVSKLFKRHILLKNSISFDERIKMAEDYIFTLEYLTHVVNYAFVESVGYYYYMRSDSAMHYNSGIVSYDGMYISVKKRYDIVSRYISLYKPSREGQMKRISETAFSYHTLFTLYLCDVKRKQRMRILNFFKGGNYREYVKYGSYPLYKKMLLYMLLSPCLKYIADALLALQNSFRRLKAKK